MNSKEYIRQSMFESNVHNELQRAFAKLGIFDISVTNIKASKDFGCVDVYCTYFGNTSEMSDEEIQMRDQKAVRFLNQQKTKISKIIADRVAKKIMPKLRFKIDSSVQESVRLAEIFKEI